MRATGDLPRRSRSRARLTREPDAKHAADTARHIYASVVGKSSEPAPNGRYLGGHFAAVDGVTVQGPERGAIAVVV